MNVVKMNRAQDSSVLLHPSRVSLYPYGYDYIHSGIIAHFEISLHLLWYNYTHNDIVVPSRGIIASVVVSLQPLGIIIAPIVA